MFEQDESIINRAADDRLNLIQELQAREQQGAQQTEQSVQARKLISEITAARLLLTDPEMKEDYDAVLFESQFGDGPGTQEMVSADVFQPDELLEPWEEKTSLFSLGFFKSKDQAVILFCASFLLGWLVLFFSVWGIIYILNRPG